jgi:hypothetical protein
MTCRNRRWPLEIAIEVMSFANDNRFCGCLPNTSLWPANGKLSRRVLFGVQIVRTQFVSLSIFMSSYARASHLGLNRGAMASDHA